MPIVFHSKSPQYEWLSNFSKHGFKLGGVMWASVEHYYQAQKYPGAAVAEIIHQAKTADQARKAGQNRSLTARPDWETIKEKIMREAVTAKFQQNRKLKEYLLATGSEELIHKSRSDLFWGRDDDGTGQNRLGVILMEVRHALRSLA